jgi:uncharacterized protein (TIGR02099 family)
MHPLRRLRRAHHGLAYLLTGVLVLMALVGLAASQVLPLAERHPGRIADWLSDRAGRPVAFDAVRTRWTRRGPLLELDNLRIGSGRQAVALGDAEVLVSQYAGLLPGRSFTELRVRNLDLTLERDAGGRWQVRGFPGQQQPGGDPFAALERLGELQVIGAKLRILAPALRIDSRVPRVDVRLQVDGARLRAGVRATTADDAVPVLGVLDFDRAKGDGTAWVGARKLDLGPWGGLLPVEGVTAVRGRGDAQAWARLRDHRLVRVDADVALRDLALQGAPLSPGQAPARSVLPRVQGRVRWSATATGWRIDAPLLRLGEGADADRIAGLAVSGGRRFALSAQRVDVAPLALVAALGPRVAPRLRRWLHEARPGARLSAVRVATAPGGRLQVRARLADAGFSAAGGAPGVRGLGGTLRGDEHALAFDLDAAAPVTVAWPGSLAAPHRIRLHGTVAGWREGTGWRAATPALALRGTDYGADLRGGLWFQGDGTRPRLDLAADVATAPVVAAKRFWLRASMPPSAVRWLDAALQGGTVRDGRAVLSGDLDLWPFRARDGAPATGVFHATARIDDAVLKFQADWPEARDLDADVAFLADGLRVRGRGASLAGVRIGGFDAAIERFGRAVLTVQAQASADAAALLGLLRQSPLQRTHGETLGNLEAAGPARVQYALTLPLHPDPPPATMRGTVALREARLHEKRWNLAFDGVTGTATYAQDGFEADALSMRHQGQSGTLSLRAGGFVRERGQAFEAELQARLGAQELLEHAPDLAWLRPSVAGTSAWTVAVALPAAATTAPARPTPSRLRLRSDLVGTALKLPAPMDKPAASALPTTVDIDLPLGEGEVAVAFGNRMALRARSAAGQTGIRVALGASRVEAPPPASGLVASGRSDRLDGIGWAALTQGGSGGGKGGLALRGVDVTAARLQLIGGEFPETRLRAVPAAGGTAVRLDGRALQGALMLPAAEGAALAGKLERLHWRAPASAARRGEASGSASGSAAASTSAAAAASAPAPAGASGNELDPSSIPPLNLAVDDLRFGDARLGSATLRTQRTAAGLRIAELSTRAPGQQIDVSGDWTRTAGGQRTQLDARVRSEDFGRLLEGFGFGGQLAKGQGSMRLQAGWPGGPGAFRLADLGGQMTLDVRDGQLVEVEPGAGRVLGLLSIAQLPRRLLFDFRDFFDKGFAFDTVKGDVQFGGGRARSENLAIEGPAAEIRICGAANLRAQTYDQTIDVYPRAGNLLTVAGALAGGPVGAAIGAAANAVLSKPLRQLAVRTYRVTGPWKDPKVETVDRGDTATRRPAQG